MEHDYRYTQMELAQLVGRWVKVEGPKSVTENFVFLTHEVEVPINVGEMRLSLWMAYMIYSHPELRITPLEKM